MLRKNGRGLTRAVLMALVFAFVPVLIASAADNRPTGPNVINTDGSTTLYPILQLAAQQIGASYPGVSIVNDTAPGTGSGHGIRALAAQLPIQGSTDPIDMALSSSICTSSNTVQLTNTVFTEGTLTAVVPAAQTTLQCANFTPIPVAKDAITILVNVGRNACINASSKNYITRDEVRAIYEGRTFVGGVLGGTTGTTTHTWNTFFSACPADTIVPRSRIVGSGTRQSFFDLSGVVSAPEQVLITSTGLDRLQGNVDIEAAIAANLNQLSYTGKAFDNANTTQIAVQDPTKNPPGPALPTDLNVANNAYPWARVIYAYYRTSQTKQAVRDLETYLYGSLMQGNIEKLDFVSIWRSTNPVVPAASEPAPAWDVDANRTGNILDVTSIGAYFGQSGPASGDPSFPVLRGWVRADVTFDGNVNILDITTFGPRFGTSW